MKNTDTMEAPETLDFFTKLLRGYFSHYAWMLTLVLLFVGGMAAFVFYSYSDIWMYAREFIAMAGFIMFLGLLFIFIKILFR